MKDKTRTSVKCPNHHVVWKHLESLGLVLDVIELNCLIFTLLLSESTTNNEAYVTLGYVIFKKQQQSF